MGSEGNMFTSSRAYAQDWSFFGYGHHLLMDLFHLSQLAIVHSIDLLMYLRKTIGISYFDASEYLDYLNSKGFKGGIITSFRLGAKYLSLGLLALSQILCLRLFFQNKVCFKEYLLISSFALFFFLSNGSPLVFASAGAFLVTVLF